MPIGPCARECRRRGRLEILLVADVRNGAFVLFAVGARRERILAAGDQVVGADGELAAPGRAPRQAEAQARQLLLAGSVDDRTEEVGAERPDGAAQRNGIADTTVPTTRGSVAQGDKKTGKAKGTE